MTRTKLTILAIVAGMLTVSAAFADDWNGLTLNVPYTLTITEHGTGSGTIKQFDGATNIAVSGGVLYSLPNISVPQATIKPFWGVCIDTREWSTSPQGSVLKQGWAAEGHAALGTLGRLNGTVVDELAWGHTTYLFSQYGATIGDMTNVQMAAFQLATWEVLSGDGGISGGNWTSGSFTATNVSGSVLSAANGYVTAAYAGFDNNWSTDLANEAFYFSGVKNNCYYQDYLVYAPTPSNTPPVPEIPAVVLGPLGLMAFGMLKRRFTK